MAPDWHPCSGGKEGETWLPLGFSRGARLYLSQKHQKISSPVLIVRIRSRVCSWTSRCIGGIIKVCGLWEGSVNNNNWILFRKREWILGKPVSTTLGFVVCNLFIAFSLGIINATVEFYGVLCLFPDHLEVMPSLMCGFDLMILCQCYCVEEKDAL